MKGNYQNAIIYGFRCRDTKRLYIGSTCQPLNIRHSKHITDYRGWSGYKNNKPRNYRSSFDIIKDNNYDVFEIKKCPCENKQELEKIESMYIYNNDCVNRQLPRRCKGEDLTDEQYKLN